MASLNEEVKETVDAGSRMNTDTISYWRDLDFSQQQKKLEEITIEIVENNQKRTDRRNNLKQHTKKCFGEISKSSLPTQVQALLDAYRSEIDTLTKEARTTDRNFARVLRPIAEAPDPTEAIQDTNRMSKIISDLQQQLQKAKQDSDAYEAELSSLNNQDITIRQLEERTSRLLDEFEERVDEKVAQRESELQAEYQNTLEKQFTAYKTLEAELSGRENTIESLNRTIDTLQSQILELRNGQDDTVAAKQQEFDALSTELEQERTRRLQVQEQLRQAKLQRTNSTDNGEHKDVEMIQAELQEAYAEANKQTYRIQELEHQVTQLHDTIETQTEQLTNAQQQIQSTRTQSEDKLKQLRNELSSRPTEAQLNELKQQLATLQTIYMGKSGDESTRSVSGTSSAYDASIRRIRQLENELVDFRQKLQAVRTECTHAIEQRDRLQQQVQDKTKLIEKLENDLAKSIGNNSNLVDLQSENSVDPPSQMSADAQLTRALNKDHDHLPSNDLIDDDTSKTSTSTKTNPSSALISVLKDQRERFRLQVQNLESQLSDANQKIEQLEREFTLLDQEKQQVEQHNRYLQSLNTSGVGAGRPHGMGPSAFYVHGHQAQTAKIRAALAAARDRALQLPVFSADSQIGHFISQGYGAGRSFVEICFLRCSRCFSTNQSQYLENDIEQGQDEHNKVHARGNGFDSSLIRITRRLEGSIAMRMCAAIYILFLHAVLFVLYARC